MTNFDGRRVRITAPRVAVTITGGDSRTAKMAKILYFAALVDKLGAASEEVALPAMVADVRTLLAWLRTRGKNWEQSLAENAVQVTVNRQFAVPETKIDNTCEIALVSARRG